MMDNTDHQRMSMNDINGQSVLMSNMELLPNMTNIVSDEQIMQLLGNQNYLISDGSHLTDNQRTVTQMDSVNSEHNTMAPMDRHSVESCNYVSNQFDPQYHDSSDSHRFKYRSSLSTVSETVTHVSETDNSLSGQTFASVGNPSVPNIGVQTNYPQLNSLNNWSHNQNHSNHSIGGQHQNRAPKDLMINTGLPSNHLNSKVTPLSGYIPRQRISNFVSNVSAINPSTTSTPVNQSHNNLVILNNNNNNNNHNNNDNININKNSSQVLNQGLIQTRRLESPTVTKRTVIIFKVIDQIVDNSGKVLKETVIKNEEIVKNFDKFDCNETTTTHISSISNVSPFASNTNSGVLADVSSSVGSTPSSGSESRQNQNNESLTKRHSINPNIDLIKMGVQPAISSIPVSIEPAIDTNYNKTNNSFTQNLEVTTLLTDDMTNQTNTGKRIDVKVEEPKINERDEEERRETATALLSLTQRSCSLNIDCNSSEPLFSSNFSIKPGNKVMAKWRDKNFYPAVILKHIPQNNKWSVIFEDKATRNLFDTELIPLNNLVEGQDIMVTISDGFCAKATILSAIYENNEMSFEVEHLKDDKKVVKRYPLRDVFLNVEQSANIAIRSLKAPLNGAVFADVDLDNIVSGKRARITTKAEVTLTDKPERVQQFKNGRRRAADAVSVDVDFDIDNEEEQTYGVKPKKKANNIRNTKKRIETHNSMFNNSEHSLSISPRTAKVHTSIPPQELIKLLGPLPEPDSRIFERVSFLLTCGDRNKGEDLSIEQSNPERSTPFDKLYLIKQIETGGGKVFDSFEQMKNSEENLDMVLIADTYHRSIKYIQCLAAGISIASHLWVIDCCRQNKYLKRDNYTLPAGFSIITNALPSDKNTFKKSSTLFKGTKFYFGSKTPEKLEALWAPVLSAAQAIIIEHNSITPATLSRKAVDIIIGDTTCSMDLVKRAKQMKIPVISSEYIVQCLINGRKLTYDASPLFSYTYNNTNTL